MSQHLDLKVCVALDMYISSLVYKNNRWQYPGRFLHTQFGIWLETSSKFKAYVCKEIIQCSRKIEKKPEIKI